MRLVRYEITAPDQTEGTVAGIAFTAGRALADSPSAGALLYFRRHQFTVTALDDEQAPTDQVPPVGESAAAGKRAGRSAGRKPQVKGAP